MKTFKKFSIFILTLIFCASVPFSAMAEFTTSIESEIQYFEDGSYLVTEIKNEIDFFSSGTKRNTKYATYYDPDDEIQWTVYLTATFSYTGSSATCTSASTSYTIYDSAWKVKEATASKSGRTATGDFLVKKYWLGIITNTVPVTIITTCDNNGNIT